MLTRHIQTHIRRKTRPLQHARKGMINLNPILGQQPPGSSSLPLPSFSEVDITPSRILIQCIPFTLPMPQQNQRIHTLLSIISQSIRRSIRQYIARCPTLYQMSLPLLLRNIEWIHEIIAIFIRSVLGLQSGLGGACRLIYGYGAIVDVESYFGVDVTRFVDLGGVCGGGYRGCLVCAEGGVGSGIGIVVG